MQQHILCCVGGGGTQVETRKKRATFFVLSCCGAGVQAGIAEVKKRLVVAPPHFVMKVVDKDGVREVKKV